MSSQIQGKDQEDKKNDEGEFEMLFPQEIEKGQEDSRGLAP